MGDLCQASTVKCSWSQGWLIDPCDSVLCSRPLRYSRLRTATYLWVIFLLKILSVYLIPWLANWVLGKRNCTQENHGAWSKTRVAELNWLHIRPSRGGLKRAVTWCQTVKASLVCVVPHPESLRTDFLTNYIITWMEL